MTTGSLSCALKPEEKPLQMSLLARARPSSPAKHYASPATITPFWPACMYLDAIDQRSQQIADLTARIEVVIEPFRSFCDLIDIVPGIGERCAEIVAETGADMSIFPTAAHLASWAGCCPGSNESAGRVKSTATRPGNPYLKAALADALSIANTHGT